MIDALVAGAIRHVEASLPWMSWNLLLAGFTRALPLAGMAVTFAVPVVGYETVLGVLRGVAMGLPGRRAKTARQA